MSFRALRAAFADALGVDGVVYDPQALARYAEDLSEEAPRKPLLAVRPKNTTQVQAALRVAREHEVALTPRVAGSSASGLTLSLEGGVVLDLSRMHRILEVSAEDRFALVEPGVTWAALRARLGEQTPRLRVGYPLAPPDSSVVAGCLLDGMTNLSLRYGSMGTWIAGLEVVLPNGHLVRTGAAAGGGGFFGHSPLPDLTGLFVGWQGTSGVVTKLGLELWPEPAVRRHLFVLVYERAGAFAMMRELARLECCDDVGAVTWPAGKLLLEQTRPLERDPEEPEVFLYLELSGQSERELSLRVALVHDALERLRNHGVEHEAPVPLADLLRLNPRFACFAETPTRLSFLLDPPGGGLSWIGAYGPLSRFDGLADHAAALMADRGFAPLMLGRPMKGGHYGALRFISTFRRQHPEEVARVRHLSRELLHAVLDHGCLPERIPPWAFPELRGRLDAGYLELFARLRQLLDPTGTLSPHCLSTAP
ncbi:MAG: FAD-binding oxidoreductase [Deltaproteobacteria bacterium]|nr:FAD-binding oxidoreductase [Deltaproteobacteria bacterium]